MASQPGSQQGWFSHEMKVDGQPGFVGQSLPPVNPKPPQLASPS